MFRNLPRSLMFGVLIFVAVSVPWLVVTYTSRSESSIGVQSGQSGTDQPGLVRAALQDSRDILSTISAEALATGEAQATQNPPETNSRVDTYFPNEYPSPITTGAQAEAIVNGIIHNIVPVRMVTRMIRRSTLSMLNDQTAEGAGVRSGLEQEYPDAPLWIVAVEAPGLTVQSLGLEGTGDVNQDAIGGFYLGFDASRGTEEIRGGFPDGSLDFSDFEVLISENLPVVSPTP